MKTSIITLALSIATTSMAQVVCIQAFTTTMTYLPALTLGPNNSCPTAKSVSYYSVEGAAGCCTDGATAAKLANKGLACCPCGAACTGYMPTIQAWTLSGDNLQITGTASTTTSTSTTSTTSASITPGQTTSGTATVSSSSSLTSTSSSGTGASPTSSSGVDGKVQNLLSGLGFFVGAFWMA